MRKITIEFPDCFSKVNTGNLDGFLHGGVECEYCNLAGTPNCIGILEDPGFSGDVDICECEHWKQININQSRIFNVEVGNLSPEESEIMIKELIKKMKVKDIQEDQELIKIIEKHFWEYL